MSDPNQRHRGAPEGNTNAAKDATLTSLLRIRCMPEEKGRYDRAARKANLKTAEWVRQKLNAAANSK